MRGAKQTAPAGIVSFLYATVPRSQANHNTDKLKNKQRVVTESSDRKPLKGLDGPTGRTVAL